MITVYLYNGEMNTTYRTAKFPVEYRSKIKFGWDLSVSTLDIFGYQQNLKLYTLRNPYSSKHFFLISLSLVLIVNSEETYVWPFS